jgi:hypothetical protein
MNSLTNIREAFLVFISLTFIALLNLGQLWEGHRSSLEYVNWELIKLLDLNDHQVKKIERINATYDFELSKIRHDKLSDGIVSQQKKDRLLLERSRQIMEVLNERQQDILYTYCTDLLSFNKLFE